MLIVILALWLVALSLVLRFLGVASEARCAACGGELELWPESRRCADCGKAAVARRRVPGRARLLPPGDERESIHDLVAAVVHGGMNRSRRANAHPPGPPAPYHRASSGSTLSAKSRTLS